MFILFKRKKFKTNYYVLITTIHIVKNFLNYRKRLWLTLIDRKDLLPKAHDLSPSLKVCEKHFSKEMFMKNNRRLTPCAIPNDCCRTSKMNMPVSRADSEDVQNFFHFISSVNVSIQFFHIS